MNRRTQFIHPMFDILVKPIWRQQWSSCKLLTLRVLHVHSQASQLIGVRWDHSTPNPPDQVKRCRFYTPSPRPSPGSAERVRMHQMFSAPPPAPPQSHSPGGTWDQDHLGDVPVLVMASWIPMMRIAQLTVSGTERIPQSAKNQQVLSRAAYCSHSKWISSCFWRILDPNVFRHTCIPFTNCNEIEKTVRTPMKRQELIIFYACGYCRDPFAIGDGLKNPPKASQSQAIQN